jgi:hypothetical protein
MLRDELIELRLSAGIVDPLGPGVEDADGDGSALSVVDHPVDA